LNTDQRWFTIDGSKSDGLYLAARPGKHGFDNDIAQELQARLKPLVRKTQPYSKRIALRSIWVAVMSGENRVSGDVGGRQGPATGLQGAAGRPMLGR
jgi:hypothetical protein